MTQQAECLLVLGEREGVCDGGFVGVHLAELCSGFGNLNIQSDDGISRAMGAVEQNAGPHSFRFDGWGRCSQWRIGQLGQASGEQGFCQVWLELERSAF